MCRHNDPTQFAREFAAALVELEAELDWELLGEVYCHSGGERFFPLEQREAVREAGLLLADDVSRALARLPAGGPGRSLYVGAGVAELAPILCEVLVLGRTVEWTNLERREVEELNRALERVEARVGGDLPRVAAEEARPAAKACDHLWLVSVLSDPVRYPGLSAELYGCGSGPAPASEREAARGLAQWASGALRPPGVVSTTDEELPLVRAACRERGWRLSVPELGRLSGIVGDVVRVCPLRGPA